jgi:hypothetical protein
LDKIPLQFDAILGMTFLENVNPIINWQARTLTTTGNNTTKDIHHLDKHDEQMLFYMDNDYASVSGVTRVIKQEAYDKDLAEMETSTPENFFFVIHPVDSSNTEKVKRFTTQGWDQLKENPAYTTLLKYKDTVFKEELRIADVVPKSIVTHTIDLIDDIPVTVKQFRLSPEQQQAVISWTDEMLAAGLIRPSTSPYASPIFCIKKPVGWRIVHDYRLLNAKTRIPQEPIPRKDAILDAMQGGYYFSCMDLLSGYYQLFLDDASRGCTAFSTPKGHFEYLVIAQGLAGAPATFNRFIQRVFVGLEDIGRAFFDDIYIFTRSQEMVAHLSALDRVLKRCETFGLTIKLSKCIFCAPEIPVLGDFVGRQGVRMDPDKVAIIRSWPLPVTKTQLKSFLGTIQYSARFCANYGELVAPLHRATIGKKKHEQIVLTDDEIFSFNALKDALTRTPTLSLPDFHRPFRVRMDASNFAIGGILFQLDDSGVERTIAYTGRKMSSAELLYPVREQELLAIVHALKTWRPYLLDQPFIVETDHQTLEALLTQRTCTQRLARWLNLLSEFRPVFKWIPGATNTTADGLSRRCDFVPPDGPASSVPMRSLLQAILASSMPTDMEAVEPAPSLSFSSIDEAMMVFQLLSSRDIAHLCRASYPTDKHFGPVWQLLLEGEQVATIIPQKYKTFTIQKNLLWKITGEGDLRLCVPGDAALRRKVLFSEHDDPSRGHPGVYKTLKFTQRKYYWLNMNEDVKHYVATCEKCQRNKYRQSRPPGELVTLPVPEARWQHIAMDFILSLPCVHAVDGIWVIIDRLTKRAHFIPVCMKDDKTSAKNCAIIFQKEFQRLHGVPETIISDRDVRFTSKFWQEFIKMQGGFHQLGSAFRPNTDGQTERTNRFVEDYIRNYVHVNQDNWPELLWSAEFAYNARVHESIGMSPFEADLGYIPRAVPDRVFDDIIKTKSNTDILALGRKQEKILVILKNNLVKAQDRMRRYYNKNRPTQHFDIGEKVMISVQNLDIEHLGIAKSGTKKFGPLWIGPYPVLKRTTPDTYKLSLPIGIKLHPEFHTSLLKPYRTDNDSDRLNKPNEGMCSAGNDNTEEAFLIEKIVGHKKVKKKVYYLVKWTGYPADHNSWEPLENIRKPASRLIDTYLEKRKLDKVCWNPMVGSSRSTSH